MNSKLRKIFGDDFSKAAFHVVDDELRLVGKYGELTLHDDGSFDVWIVNPDRSPMNSLRLNTILGKMKNRWKEAYIKKLDGEAWCNVFDKDIAVEYGFLMGIKRKRRVSAEQAEAAKQRFAKYRNERGMK